MWDPYAEFQTTVLPNGLTVHGAHWPGRPWQYMNFIIHSGANQDPEGREGLAHFVEHLVSANTHLDEAGIGQYAEDRGGYAHLGSTSLLRTKYGFKSRCDVSLDNLLWIYGHMLLAARLEHGAEAERKAILSEYYRKHSLPKFVQLQSAVMQLLFPGSRRGLVPEVIGSPEIIATLNAHEAQSYYDQHYVPANVSVVTVGGLAFSEVVERIKQSPLAIAKPGQRNPLPMPTSNHPAPAYQLKHLQLNDWLGEGHGQTTCALKGWAVIPGRVSYQLVGVLRQLLAEQLQKIMRRERGWAYGVSVGMDTEIAQHSLYISSSGLPVEAAKELPEILKQALHRIAHDNKSLARLRQQRIQNMEMMDSTARDVLGSATVEVAHGNRVSSFAEGIAGLRAITQEHLKELIDYLDDHWYLEIMLP